MATTLATTPVTTTTVDIKADIDAKVKKWGDANNDNTVDMGDVVLIMQALANPNKYGLEGSDSKHLTAKGACSFA